eukprot:UN08118
MYYHYKICKSQSSCNCLIKRDCPFCGRRLAIRVVLPASSCCEVC